MTRGLNLTRGSSGTALCRGGFVQTKANHLDTGEYLHENLF